MHADDPVALAAAAGLRYVSDDGPGIRRVRVGKGFSYRLPKGGPVTDRAERRRIDAIVIPPAWDQVWICPDPRGHIQATGRDEKRRKQYRYHPDWRAKQEAVKYEHLATFARALPALRARVAHDLARPGLPREKVLATVVELLERTLIRVGNADYLKANGTQGLTTLANESVAVHGSTLRFAFKGKSGRQWELGLHDRRLAGIVRRCQELPGQSLFGYRDADGEARSIDSADVNAYLREATGADITAKDVRTWAGTVRAATALARAIEELGDDPTPTALKRAQARAVRDVARALGNTPAVTRSSYIHPAVLEGHAAGTLRLAFEQAQADGLHPDEAAVLAWLEARAQMPPPQVAAAAGRAARATRNAGRQTAARPRGAKAKPKAVLMAAAVPSA